MKTNFLFLGIGFFIAAGPRFVGANHIASIEDGTPTPLFSQYVDEIQGTSLETLVTLALKQNYGLSTERKGIAIVEGAFKQAGARPNPTRNIA